MAVRSGNTRPNFELVKAHERIIQLECLCNSFEQLNQSLDLDVVLMNTLKNATELMKAETGSLALVDKESKCLRFVESTDKNFDKLKDITVPLGEGIAGSVAVSGQPIRLEDITKDERFYAQIDKKMGHTTRSYLCVPLLVDEEIIGTAQIMNRLDGRSFCAEDEELMMGFARQAALAIKNARLHQVLLEQKAIESELEICAQIQQKIFPESPPANEKIEFYGSSVPCQQVGGDYYAFIERSDGSIDVIIADVSGKGLSAALMVSELHTAIQMLSQNEISLENMIIRLNDHLVDSLLLGKFITLFAIRISPDRKTINHVVAGHPPPGLIKKNGDIVLLEGDGMALGITSNARLSEKSFTMESGDILFTFTDGYSEARSPGGELFDDERLISIVRQNRTLPLTEIRNRLDREILKYTHNAPAPDDATLVLIRYK